MKHKKRNSTQQQPLRKWLIGDANRHDERALDAAAKDDPFLADALEGYRSQPEADHAADVTRLKARLRKQSESRRGAGFYLLRIAAVGAVLVAAWVVLQQFQANDKSASVADSTSAEVQSAPTESASAMADSVAGGIAQQEKPESEAADEQMAFQPEVSAKRKKEAPQSSADAGNQTYNYSNDADLATESAAPPPVTLMDSRPEPAVEADDKIASEEIKPAADMAKAKTSAPEARKRADNAPAASKPIAPANSLRNITGTVTDESGQTLIGALILAKGTGIGTISDIDGNYTIGVPKTATTLVFSFNPYGDIQIGIGEKDRIDVVLTGGNNLDIGVGEFIVPADAVDAATGSISPPRPTGGFSTYLKYLDENKLHPEAEKRPRPGFLVMVGFTLQEDGTLTNFTSKSKAPQAYIDETIRLLKAGPRWEGTPGASAVLYYSFK